ncbi:uncharacterized protein LOC115332830 [Ixodes scapularis]|uniref:uncharacterized protein LOC115332830 n=1 Tax=Ixodes scapularis TaxID=6945 RepID=UPI001C38A2C2|nr:uncharacterized protein LOC115332830 [Ixodes scapularis]
MIHSDYIGVVWKTSRLAKVKIFCAAASAAGEKYASPQVTTAIGHEGVYFLMLGTRHLPYDCVSINVTAVFPKIAIHYRVTKYIASIRVNETYNGVALIHKDVRGVESTIEWIKNESGRREETQVLYTEKENRCFVLFYTDTSDYELWVNTNETNFLPRCCEFAFEFVTYEVPTYINFNYTICKRVV